MLNWTDRQRVRLVYWACGEGMMSQFISACGTFFVGIGFLCAPFAAAVTFAVYVAYPGQLPGTWRPGASIAIGFVLGAAAVAGIRRVYRHWYRQAGDVYPDQNLHLRRRLEAATHRLATCEMPELPTCLQRAARADAEKISGELADLLAQPNTGWISAMGYLEAWSDLNRTEEAMLQFLPLPHVLALARDDLSRLQGSGSGGLQHLQSRLQSDIEALEKPASPDAELRARADLVLVHNAINRTREDQWGQLVGSRNNMMLAAAIAGVIGYLALVSVVFWRMDPKALEVAVTFLVTGTLISLLHQVTLVGTHDGGVADFGQSTARLLAATFVSGLIALLGVVVVEGMNVHVNINGADVVTPFATWRDTFDWTRDKAGYFWAAAFGLTPSLLFTLLQKRTDEIKSSLNSTRATGGS